MASFGDDVSMSDFHPNTHQQHVGGSDEKEHQTSGGLINVGHTSDGSVLNVPPSSGGLPGAVGAFPEEMPPPTREVSATWVVVVRVSFFCDSLL